MKMVMMMKRMSCADLAPRTFAPAVVPAFLFQPLERGEAVGLGEYLLALHHLRRVEVDDRRVGRELDLVEAVDSFREGAGDIGEALEVDAVDLRDDELGQLFVA